MTSVKKLLKKIFPTPLLKAAFSVYNKIRINTVDKIIFPEHKISKENFFLYREGFPFREENISVDDLADEQVRNFMRQWHDWTQEEFILVFDKPCWIEPAFGWAIVPRNKLLYYSLGVSRTWFQPKPPVLWSFNKPRIMHVKKAISLRDTGEENYFHFYNDVISKLFFLVDRKIEIQNIPIIVSTKLWQKEYFQYYYQHSDFLKSLTWIVQQADEYIYSESTIFCKPLTHKKKLWEEILFPVRSKPASTLCQKVFLTRSKARLRFIENMEEIETICRKSGFEILDTDNLPLADQISLFANVDTLVGIHGAGLTNMVYRNGDCSVLEIFPPPDRGYLPYHYILLAKLMGFKYTALVGEPGKIRYSGGFYLDPTAFEASLSAMTNS